MAGIGNAGCRILDEVVPCVGPDGVVTVAINTDANALNGSQASAKLPIGHARTAGLGAGGDVELAKTAAMDDIAAIQGLFSQKQMVVAIVGLGGGTGTGAAPVILENARHAGALTLCIGIMPFKFEGDQRQVTAFHSIPSLRVATDALIIVRNDQLAEFTGKENLTEVFSSANRLLGSAVCAISKLLTHPGVPTIDYPMLQETIRSCEGIATLGYGEGHGPNRAELAVKDLFENPLLKHGEIAASSRSLLVSILGGDDLSIREVREVMETVASRTARDVALRMGTVIDNNWKGRLCITVIAGEKWASLPDQPKVNSLLEHESARRRRKGKTAPVQPDLGLDMPGRASRFKGVDPTLMDGEDLDIPTYIRRKIKLNR